MALNKFISGWRSKPEVIGALVCGSYITGDPNENSDIDVHIILSSNIKWRERGNLYVNGYLVEYFANPPQQILKYFEEDYKSNSWMSMVQFVTGKVIFDETGEIAKLKEKANNWMLRPFSRIDDDKVIEAMKYSIWDIYDNLQVAFKGSRSDFYYIFFNNLSRIFEIYSKYIGWYVPNTDQQYELLSNEKFRAKYMIRSFPNINFAKKFKNALSVTIEKDMMINFKDLVDYVLEEMGGFNIDGWKLNSKVEY